MTIITKSSTAKKEDTGVLPLFQNQHHHQAPNGIPVAVAERRVNYPCRAVFILIMVALTVLTLGIIGSTILARFYGNQHTERLRFQCRLPYRSEDLNRQTLLHFNRFPDDSSDEDREVQLATFDWMRQLANSFSSRMEEDLAAFNDDESSSQEEDDEAFKQLMDKYFTEEVDMTVGQHPDDEGVTKIDVPVFKDSREGRFMHDFRYNQTAIVDLATNRCFLMPLDREKVLKPAMFIDLLRNLMDGSYNLDMQVVQENMRVVVPALDDLSEVSPRIVQSCPPSKMRIYRLEKYVSGVVKRSAELGAEAKFGVFSGTMVQYDLHNMNEVAQYEQAVAGN